LPDWKAAAAGGGVLSFKRPHAAEYSVIQFSVFSGRGITGEIATTEGAGATGGCLTAKQPPQAAEF